MSLLPPVQSVLEAMGQTPTLELIRLRPPGGARVFAKLESLGQTGSSEDRVALARLKGLRESGELAPGATLVVASLGDFAISAVTVAKALGHPIQVVIPESASLERQQILRTWRVPMELSPSDAQLTGAAELGRARCSRVPGAVLLAEDEEASAAVHEVTTGVEMARTAVADGQPVHAFVCGPGPGGLLRGIGRSLRTAFPGVRLFPVVTDPGPHHLQGLAAASSSAASSSTEGLEPPVRVSQEQAWDVRASLGRAEGLLVSLFGAANVAAALQVARMLGPEARVDTVIPAGGEREFSLGDYFR